MNDFGIEDDIKALRKKLSLSQEKFADAVGVHKHTVQNWEYHKALPTRANVQSLIAALHLKREEYPELFDFAEGTYKQPEEEVLSSDSPAADIAVAAIADKDVAPDKIDAKPSAETEPIRSAPATDKENPRTETETETVHKATRILNIGRSENKTFYFRLKKWSPIIKTAAIAAGIWFICRLVLFLICVYNLATPSTDGAVDIASIVCINSRRAVLYSVLSFIIIVVLSALGRIIFEWSKSNKTKAALAVPLGVIFLIAPHMADSAIFPRSVSYENDTAPKAFQSVDYSPSSYLFARLDLYVYCTDGYIVAELKNGFSLFSPNISAAVTICGFAEKTTDISRSIYMKAPSYTENLKAGENLKLSYSTDWGDFYWVAYAAFYDEENIAMCNTEPCYILDGVYYSEK